MASELCEKEVDFCERIRFTLNIKKTVEPEPVKKFPLETTRGQTLLQALQAYERENTTFRFQTDTVPTSGPYVKSVNGENNGANTYWETLLFDEKTQFVKPISLSYQICPNDNVYLRFSLF